MNCNNKLTILIPTYNRKERLFNTISNIYNQGHWGEYKIVIVDNHSDYSVQEMINQNFCSDFVKSVMVFRWKFNTGMSTNISIAFEFVETEWCWFLSDDDEILNGSLDIVLSDIQRYGNYSAIKYSIEGICKYDNTTISSVSTLLDYYAKHDSGDKYYLSMLYNIKQLYPYMSELTVRSYTYLSFWLPIIRILNEQNNPVLMSSNTLYSYKKNNDSWSSSPEKYLQTILGIRTLFDSTYNLSFTDFKKLKKVFFSNLFFCNTVIIRILLVDDNNLRKHYYKLLNNYIVGKYPMKLIAKIIYYLFVSFHIPSQFIYKLKEYRRNM